VQLVAAGRPQGAVLDAPGQLATGGDGAAVGLGVLQRAGLLLAQAHGFAQPQSVEGGRWGAIAHSVSGTGSWGASITAAPRRVRPPALRGNGNTGARRPNQGRAYPARPRV